MAQLQGRGFDQPKPERYYIEYVEVSTDEAASNGPLRKAINEKLQQGWKLVSITMDRSSGVAELVWDTSGFRIRD